MMLEALRGKRLMFVGDSLNRGQFYSMVCLLHSVLPNESKSMEINFGSLSTFTAKVTSFFCLTSFFVGLSQIRSGQVRLGQVRSDQVEFSLNVELQRFDPILLGSVPPRIELRRRHRASNLRSDRSKRLDKQAWRKLEGSWYFGVQHIPLVDDWSHNEDPVTSL